MSDGLTITPSLLFTGQAKDAMDFYTSVFPDSRVEFMQLYGPEFPGPEGKVAFAQLSLAGHTINAMDSGVDQPFSFTPAFSLTITHADEAEIDRLFAALSDGGEVLMPLDAYPFAARYAWVADRFGVSWQLMIA